MSVGVLSNLNVNQMNEIVEYRRSAPIADISFASSKARRACAAYYKDWHSTFTSYHTAILASVGKMGGAYSPLKTVTLLACAEELALANMAKDHLTVDEYNLLVYPVAKAVMNELLETEQWEIKPLPEGNQISAIESHFKHVFEKKARRQRDYSSEEIEEKGVDTESLLRAMMGMKKPKEKPRVAVNPMDAIKAMLEKVKVDKDDGKETEEESEEAEEVIGVRAKKSDDGTYGLFDSSNNEIASGFESAIAAISFAAKDKGLKLIK